MEKRCGAVVTYWFICRHIRILHGDIILIPLLGVGAGGGAMHRRWPGNLGEPGWAEDHNNLYTAAFIWYTQTGVTTNTLSLSLSLTHTIFHLILYLVVCKQGTDECYRY